MIWDWREAENPQPGEIFKRIRTRRNVQQNQFPLSRNTISRLERGQSEPSLDTRRKLAATLEIPNEVISEIWDPTPSDQRDQLRNMELEVPTLEDDSIGRDGPIEDPMPGHDSKEDEDEEFYDSDPAGVDPEEVREESIGDHDTNGNDTEDQEDESELDLDIGI
jgi:transcriptional regulator with XRE-family HTH domain